MRRVLVFHELALSSPTVGIVDQELRDALAIEPEKTLEGALRLQPDTQHVVVVGGMSPLVSMRERLKLVDGELSIDCQVQKGTEVRATIPLISKASAVGKT